MPFTILITGSNSLLGKALYDELIATYQLILTYNRSKPAFATNKKSQTLSLDITNAQAVAKVIRAHKPTIILHLASISNIDHVQKNQELATAVNVEGTRIIIKALRHYPKTKLVFFSSSAVFDGVSTPAKEKHTPRPLNFYGHTKYHTEGLVSQINNPYLIIRLTTLFGWQPEGARENPATFIIDKLMQKKQLSIVSDYFTNPLYAPSAARIIHQLLQRDITGIIHVGGITRVSRFGWAKQIARVFSLDQKLIVPQKMHQFTGFAPRARDATLSIAKIRNLLNNTPSSIYMDLKAMLKDRKNSTTR